jgi:hypothetical protein
MGKGLVYLLSTVRELYTLLSSKSWVDQQSLSRLYAFKSTNL